jgi:signal transduction histidine kinase
VTASLPGVSFHDFSAGRETGRLIRAKDWSTTSLGPRSSWPRSLTNSLSMILELPTAAILFWGPDQVQLYNDGYAVIMGPRHPRHLGSTFRECWPEAYDAIIPWMRRVLEKGETVEVNQTLVPLTRHGFTEEAYFTFSFSPLRDDEGKIAGVLQLVTEVTNAVLGERRTRSLHALSSQTANARTLTGAASLALDVLRKENADVPFCLLYLSAPEDRDRLVAFESAGLADGFAPFPAEVNARLEGSSVLPELSRAVRERTLVPFELDPRDVARLIQPPAERPRTVVALPILASESQHAADVLLIGINPRLALDGPYRAFLELVAAQVANLLGTARANDEERKRAEALAAIDRAKTEFFSNVSHEFRTPLTLMLGPLEDALGPPAGGLEGEALEAVHRNALRLLRLVNALLDFARLEANRLTSSIEATDLATLTRGLAGSFQSLLDAAGVKLRIDCPPLSTPVMIDRAQWEKIVLNLLSNAYKFTFAGEIAVVLEETTESVRLSVRDTGTGIPADEVPKLFTRFHRVSGARGRSFEGSGIGLALVHELVKQHGGSVTWRVRSVEARPLRSRFRSRRSRSRWR